MSKAETEWKVILMIPINYGMILELNFRSLAANLTVQAAICGGFPFVLTRR
jgi:hypothetical protein